MTLKTIKFSLIKIDAGTQYRDTLDQDKVAEYADCMENGDKFPPMEVAFDGTHYYLWDGFTRYFAMHRSLPKLVEVNYRPGTLEDAQIWAMGANATHGQPRNTATKINVVQKALEHPNTRDLSDRDIAKLCKVSHPFVASIRNPEVKEKQKKNRENYGLRSASEVESIPPEGPVEAPVHTAIPSPAREDNGPSEAEIAESEEMLKANQELIDTLIESDDKFATLMAEHKKVLAENVTLKMRMRGLVNERNEAVKQAKQAQSKLDKIAKAKK